MPTTKKRIRWQTRGEGESDGSFDGPPNARASGGCFRLTCNISLPFYGGPVFKAAKKAGISDPWEVRFRGHSYGVADGRKAAMALAESKVDDMVQRIADEDARDQARKDEHEHRTAEQARKVARLQELADLADCDPAGLDHDMIRELGNLTLWMIGGRS